MIAEIDIYRAARVLIDHWRCWKPWTRWSATASSAATDGMTVWARIADAIETLPIPARLSTQTAY
jgi:hypothetical protein